MFKPKAGGFQPPRRLVAPAGPAASAAHAVPASTSCAASCGEDEGAVKEAPSSEAEAPAPVQPSARPVPMPSSLAAQRPHLKPLNTGVKPLNPGAASSTHVKPGCHSGGGDATLDEGSVFAVLYTKKELLQKKKASKKHADGVLLIKADGTAVLHDLNSKAVYKGRYKKIGGGAASLACGDPCGYELGTWHAEVDKELSLEQFRSGACFDTTCSAAQAAPPGTSMQLQRPAPQPFKRHVPAGGGSGGTEMGPYGPRPAQAATAQSLHDPHGADALVLNGQQWKDGQGRQPDGKAVVPVVVDPFIRRHLRPHQVEGVQFMYESVMGQRVAGKAGCILADEMGLGKTLQVITLVWTLLRQGPTGPPVASKVLVVAPATLVQQWVKEVKKWLGSERLQALALVQGPEAKQQIELFKHGPQNKMMVASYETLRKYGADLAGVFQLLVCDEGHRLKSVGGNRTMDALLSLNCGRRIILTGTPMQNNLDEFYALVSFVVPDLLGPSAAFKRIYGGPIMQAQDRTASKDDKDIGAARARELQAKTSSVILRRTRELLTKHLPPCATHTLYCKPSEQQVRMYQAIIRTKAVTSILYGGSGSSDSGAVLGVITALRKLVNHPDLLLGGRSGEEELDGLQPSTSGQPPQSWLHSAVHAFQATQDANTSGKMQVLSELLRGITARGERCVVVSTSTAALDIIEELSCKPLGLRTVRIVGSTNVDERQTVVDNFNKLGLGQVFLLSTRAGGAGLNLIGANHLVLYDPDWNPGMDQQAMGRIWRDGQTKACCIYRLLTTGTIDEKVYQRQLMKGGLASAAMTGSATSGKFSQEELRQLFGLNEQTLSDTRDLMGDQHGLAWLEVAQVPEDGGPLRLAARCGAVSCISKEATAAQQEQAQQEQADAGPDSSDDDDGCGGAAASDSPMSDEDEDFEQQQPKAQPGRATAAALATAKRRRCGLAVRSDSEGEEQQQPPKRAAGAAVPRSRIVPNAQQRQDGGDDDDEDNHNDDADCLTLEDE